MKAIIFLLFVLALNASAQRDLFNDDPAFQQQQINAAAFAAKKKAEAEFASKQQAAANQQEQMSFDQRWKQSRQTAFKRYPDCRDENSSFFKKTTEIWDRLVSEGNPIVNDPSAPERLADMAAGALGVSPTQ